MLKLYREGVPKTSAFREAAIVAAIELLDLPAPTTSAVSQFGGRWGIVMSKASGISFGDGMLQQPESVPAYLEAMARLHGRIHACPAPRLGDQKAALAANILKAPQLGEAQRRRLLDGLAARPAGDRLCHGDFHPWNIIGTRDDAMIVDWLDASRGVPEADTCRSHVLMLAVRPDLAEGYMAAYCAHTGVGRDVVLSWTPYIAAARLAEGAVPDVAALVAMAERL